MAMAIPSFGDLRQRYNLKGAAQQLVIDLRTAQGLAIRQSSPHRIDFALNTPVTPPVQSGDSGTYDDMYQVVCPAGGTVCGTGSLPRRYRGAPSDGIEIVSSVDNNGNPANSISFNSSGYVTTPAALPVTVTLRACAARAGDVTGETVQVLVQRTGRIQATKVADGSCA